MASRSRLFARRRQLGLSITCVAHTCKVHPDTYAAWEAGTQKPRTYQHRALADVLEVPLTVSEVTEDEHDLDWYLVRDDEVDLPAWSREQDQQAERWHDGDVDRREFLGGTVALAATRTVSAGQSRVIGDNHVVSVDAALRRQRRQDAVTGGDRIYREAVGLRSQVEHWLERGSFTQSVGGTLQSRLGELSAWTGWLAFDSGRLPEAGHHLQDALVHARLHDDPALEVRALSCMCLLFARTQRPRAALQSAEAALRRAEGWATPRLVALLHLRAAHAHAHLGDASGFGREMAKANARLDRGAHPDDPLYIAFVTPQEATGIAGLSHLALGRPERAAHSFREITADPDPARPRNVGFYTMRLAQAVVRQGDITQASEIGVRALPAVASLESRRTTKLLAGLRATVEPHRATLPAARHFADAYDETFAR